MSHTAVAFHGHNHDSWNQPVQSEALNRKVLLWGQEHYLPEGTPLEVRFQVEEVQVSGKSLTARLDVIVTTSRNTYAGVPVYGIASFPLLLVAKKRDIEKELLDQAYPSVTLESLTRLVRIKVAEYGLNSCLNAMLRKRFMRYDKIRRLIPARIPIK